MKYILGIQTAEFPNSIALVDGDGDVIEEMVIETKGQTEEVLRTLTEDLLKENNVDIEELDAIAICVGPGSYTGLRVGLAFVKGLAQFTEIPLIPVDSIEASRLGNERLTPLLDARNERVYYKKGDELKVDDVKTAFKDLDLSNDDTLIGTGAEVNQKYLTEMLGKDNLDLNSNLYKLSAENVAKYAAQNKLVSQTPFEIKPLYVQEARITESKKK